VLTNVKIDEELKATIKNMAPYHDWIVAEMESDVDHIHILLSAPPRYSPAEIVKLIKTWTQKQIFKKYPKEVKQYLWGGKFWGQGFYVSTVSDNTTKAEIEKYIKNQRKELKQLGLF
jgi:putative transposase